MRNLYNNFKLFHSINRVLSTPYSERKETIIVDLSSNNHFDSRLNLVLQLNFKSFL